MRVHRLRNVIASSRNKNSFVHLYCSLKLSIAEIPRVMTPVTFRYCSIASPTTACCFRWTLVTFMATIYHRVAIFIRNTPDGCWSRYLYLDRVATLLFVLRSKVLVGLLCLFISRLPLSHISSVVILASGSLPFP